MLVLPCKGLSLAVFQELAALTSVSKHGGWERKEAVEKQQRQKKFAFLVTNLSFLVSR